MYREEWPLREMVWPRETIYDIDITDNTTIAYLFNKCSVKIQPQYSHFSESHTDAVLHYSDLSICT